MKKYLLMTCIAMVGCAPIPIPTSSVQNVELTKGKRVWVVQHQPGENDKVILCQSNKYPVCTQVWDGNRSTFQENTLPENPYQ